MLPGLMVTAAIVYNYASYTSKTISLSTIPSTGVLCMLWTHIVIFDCSSVSSGPGASISIANILFNFELWSPSPEQDQPISSVEKVDII